MLRRLLQRLAGYRPDPAFIQAREEAYERAFGTKAQILHSVDHKRPHIDLYVFGPAGPRDFVAIVTGGMSDLPMAVPEGSQAAPYVELAMGVDQHEYWATNLLKLAAEYPFQQGTFFDVHHTLAFGCELGDGSALSAFLFVEPRIVPGELLQFEFGGRRVRFLQAVAITTAEHQFAMQQGSDKLEALLEERGFLITRDPKRPSVVPDAQ